MSLAAKVREQLLSSFRAELTEHVQTMNDGLLALEQGAVSGEQRKTTLENIFRAAHSLKGAARAMGVTMVEQLAHALESVLDDMQKSVIQPTTALFTACYRAVDAILIVQATYETGETTPPVQAMQALTDLQQARAGAPAASSSFAPQPVVEPRREPPKPAPAPAPAHEPPLPPVAPEPARTAAPPPQAETAAPPPPEPPALAESPPPSAAESAPIAPAFAGDETIRVSVSKLDALMAQLSELLVTKIRAEQRLAQVRHLYEFMSAWQKEWLAARSAYNRMIRHDTSGALGVRRLGPVETAPGEKPRERDRAGDLGERAPVVDSKVGKDIFRLLNYLGASQERLRELGALINEVAREYSNDTMHMSLVINELEQEIKRVRMLPLTTITGTFGRMVRDLAQQSNKEVVLQIVGGETELDKRVLEQIKDPLIHLLRNAVDHGIESPQRRLAAGKPRAGVITLSAEQLGKDVIVSVADDGGGLDLEAIREVIRRRGGVDVHSLTDEDLKEAIFNAGVSTSPIITDISGRGVGLDVVRRNVEALHGRIDLDSKPGRGTVFTLTIPLTLTSSRGLLVHVADELFAIPHNAIERIMLIRQEEITSLEGHDTILYNNRPLTLVRLGDILEIPATRTPAAAGTSPSFYSSHAPDSSQDKSQLPVVILAAAERRMAFAVDALAGEQEVVIKGLGKQLSRVGGVAGATVMGSGEVVLILNVADLIKLGLRSDQRSILAALTRTAPVEKQARRRILIVDDSITTRTLEKNILEAAGYHVELATDGQEALGAIMSGGAPDLIVSDVVMPRLDGFGLTKRVKEDPRTANVPVILVTSLDSPEDKARGIEVGADAYITKSSFDQNGLLETIEQLI